MFTFEFKCPECGEEDIEKVMEAESTTFLLDGVGDEDEKTKYVAFDTERAYVDNICDMRFQCAGCGLKLADDDEAMLAWLREHKMVCEETEPLPRAGEACPTTSCSGSVGVADGNPTCPECGCIWESEDE